MHVLHFCMRLYVCPAVWLSRIPLWMLSHFYVDSLNFSRWRRNVSHGYLFFLLCTDAMMVWLWTCRTEMCRFVFVCTAFVVGPLACTCIYATFKCKSLEQLKRISPAPMLSECWVPIQLTVRRNVYVKRLNADTMKLMQRCLLPIEEGQRPIAHASFALCLRVSS